METPITHLYLRHYVRDATTLERYRDIVFRALKLASNPSFSISAVIGFHPDLSADHRYQMFLLSRNLLDHNLSVHHLPGKGAGHAFLFALSQSMKDVSPSASNVLCLLDADQFPFDEPSFQERLIKLASSMCREGKLAGLGIRDHLSLGDGNLGQLREIDEMYQALFVRRKVAYAARKDALIPQSYKDLGDPLTGCYCFNLRHQKLSLFFAQCMRDAQRANLWGYAADPYIIMLASTFGKIITEVVPTHDNPPGLFTLADIEKKSIELGKTILRKDYLACVKSERNMKVIQKYYPTEDVVKVKEMILRGLAKR